MFRITTNIWPIGFRNFSGNYAYKQKTIISIRISPSDVAWCYIKTNQAMNRDYHWHPHKVSMQGHFKKLLYTHTRQSERAVHGVYIALYTNRSIQWPAGTPRQVAEWSQQTTDKVGATVYVFVCPQRQGLGGGELLAAEISPEPGECRLCHTEGLWVCSSIRP